MRNLRQIRTTLGFTLMELLLAISILAILTSFALPSYVQYTQKAKVGVAIQFLNGAVTEKTTELINSGVATVSEPSSKPIEILQCITVDVYKDRNAGNECTDVYIEAWPSTVFQSDVRLGRTRMLVFNGKLDPATGTVNWACGPYRNSKRNIDATLLPSACQDNIPRPRGKRCTTGKEKKLNVKCTRNK